MLFLVTKYIHLTAVILSISGFILRVWLMLQDSPYQHKYWFKKLPHKVDTVLLLSALAMVWQWHINPLTTPWLAEKILGLLCYIVFGMFALRWAKNKPYKLMAAIAAVSCFAYIVFVANYKVATFLY